MENQNSLIPFEGGTLAGKALENLETNYGQKE